LVGLVVEEGADLTRHLVERRAHHSVSEGLDLEPNAPRVGYPVEPAVLVESDGHPEPFADEVMATFTATLTLEPEWLHRYR